MMNNLKRFDAAIEWRRCLLVFRSARVPCTDATAICTRTMMMMMMMMIDDDDDDDDNDDDDDDDDNNNDDERPLY